jgi:hypothetical protein
MQSNALLVTAIIACLGVLINSTVMFLVLSRGRQRYHYLFAAILLAHVIWDFGIFMTMLRNNFTNEVIIYCYVVCAGAVFFPALIYHFTCSYLNRPRKKSTIFIWAYCLVMFLLFYTGLVGDVGVYHHSWGNTFRFESMLLVFFSLWLVVCYSFIWTSCWFFFRAYRRENSPLARRHLLYILISLIVVSVSVIKGTVVYGVSNRYLMPICILLTDLFGALIGMAIVKYRLLDITVIVKKTTIYSILLAIIIFVFSLSEHMLATYVGRFFGEHSIFIHLISIAVVIAVLLPIRQRIEHAIERFFARKTVEF